MDTERQLKDNNVKLEEHHVSEVEVQKLLSNCTKEQVMPTDFRTAVVATVPPEFQNTSTIDIHAWSDACTKLVTLRDHIQKALILQTHAEQDVQRRFDGLIALREHFKKALILKTDAEQEIQSRFDGWMKILRDISNECAPLELHQLAAKIRNPNFGFDKGS